MEPLTRGTTYFRVTYSDPDLTMPGLEPLVYLGVDVFDRDQDAEESIHYFQDTVSFCWRGYADENPNGIVSSGQLECRLYPHKDSDLSGIVDLVGAAEAVTRAKKRAEHLGYPTLRPKRCSG